MNQLGGDAHSLPLLANRPCQNVANVELAGNLGDR